MKQKKIKQQDKPRGKSKYSQKRLERQRIARQLGCAPSYPIIWQAQQED